MNASSQVVVRAVLAWLDAVHGEQLRLLLRQRDELDELMARRLHPRRARCPQVTSEAGPTRCYPPLPSSLRGGTDARAGGGQLGDAAGAGGSGEDAGRGRGGAARGGGGAARARDGRAWTADGPARRDGAPRP